ncbi:surface-adhesin E family protein [Brevundimonas diminuta]|uniref:surface-adhesin E family protein n=1 Tax=Brevundimonas diminuta TaxID=293 RepID=UPI0013788A0C|nr:surface-adhesin E family protein [Brevundimonas diminuta]
MKLALIAAVSLFATPTIAGEWAWVASGEVINVGMDRATVRKVGNRSTAWVATVYPTPQTVAGMQYTFRVERRVFDCAEETQAVNYVAIYMDNRQVDARTLPGEPSPMIPDTTGYGVMTAACSPANITGPFYGSSFDFAEAYSK